MIAVVCGASGLCTQADLNQLDADNLPQTDPRGHDMTRRPAFWERARGGKRNAGTDTHASGGTGKKRARGAPSSGNSSAVASSDNVDEEAPCHLQQHAEKVERIVRERGGTRDEQAALRAQLCSSTLGAEDMGLVYEKGVGLVHHGSHRRAMFLPSNVTVTSSLGVSSITTGDGLLMN